MIILHFITFRIVKNQIYIILSIFILFSSCKEDSPIEEPDNIFFWDLGNTKLFHRADTIIDVKSEIISPFKVRFNYLNLANGKLHYTLYLDGGDTLQFLQNDCNNILTKDILIDNNQNYGSKYVIDKYSEGMKKCTSDTTFYIAYRKTFKNKKQSNFGWMKIKKPLQGYWIVDNFAYNLGNHKPIFVGQKE